MQYLCLSTKAFTETLLSNSELADLYFLEKFKLIKNKLNKGCYPDVEKNINDLKEVYKNNNNVQIFLNNYLAVNNFYHGLSLPLKTKFYDKSRLLLNAYYHFDNYFKNGINKDISRDENIFFYLCYFSIASMNKKRYYAEMSPDNQNLQIIPPHFKFAQLSVDGHKYLAIELIVENVLSKYTDAANIVHDYCNKIFNYDFFRLWSEALLPDGKVNYSAYNLPTPVNNNYRFYPETKNGQYNDVVHFLANMVYLPYSRILYNFCIKTKF